MQLNDPKVIRAWCVYDWANSVYSLVITSTIFPVYYNSVTSANGSDLVNFFGWELPNTVLYSYSLSFSFLVIAAVLPILTGISDYSGKKKGFMQFFVVLGSLSCMGLFFFNGENVEWGIMCSVMASVGYSGSIVFYNAYLPEIVSHDKYDIVSAKGYSYGYIGSVLLLILNLVMIEQPGWFGLSEGSLPAKISFLLVGVWWIGFSQITFAKLPTGKSKNKKLSEYIFKGYREIQMIWSTLTHLPNLKKYLLAFFFYNMGVQTVMYLAASFGDKELQLSAGKLILTVLIIQLVAILGSYLFAKISERRGNRYSLILMVIIWILICISAYFVVEENSFYALAFAVGMVMGGIQSLSRATYAKLIPKGTQDLASYFSFYDVTYNVSIVLGTLAYGAIEHLTGSMRNSTIALASFFVIGLFFLFRVVIPASKEESVSYSEVSSQ